MAFQTLLCEGSPLCAGTAIIGIREDRDTTTGSKETRNLYILRIHQLNKILHNSIHTILVEVTMTAETIKIKLQTLALYHLYIRNITDADLRKVRLARDGAQGGELRAIEANPIVVLLVHVLEGLKNLRSIVVFIPDLLAKGLQAFLFAFFLCHINSLLLL